MALSVKSAESLSFLDVLFDCVDALFDPVSRDVDMSEDMLLTLVSEEELFELQEL